MTIVIYHAISQTKLEKNDKKKQLLLDHYQFQVFKETVTSVSSHKIKTTYQGWKYAVWSKTKTS